MTSGGSGFAATTIDRPSYGYPGMFNFFDPDNFLTLSAVLGAGDPFLSSQVRRVLEESGASISATGQVPHHFEYGSAVFSALSGATMPGPNSFWIRTCLRYAQYTGDLPWLRGYLPQMRHALGYLRSMVNSSVGLLRSSGSLFIDIFDRHGFTSDGNAMLIGLLEQFADAEEVAGSAAAAAQLRGEAAALRGHMEARLWARSDDHFVTALLDDNRTVYDMVD
eukprot:COSAG04_NODE_1325_length_7211_cov_23.584505_3_plen_222_part_00